MQLMAAFQESFEGKVHNFLVSNVESFNNLTREKPLPLKPYPKSTGQVPRRNGLYIMSMQFHYVRLVWGPFTPGVLDASSNW